MERGNALFLILIAVALFAALSYAITNSGRGGSGIDKEQAQIAAASLVQMGAMAKSAAQRAYVTGGYGQVHMSKQNTGSVLCYSGATDSPCEAVGLFSPEIGLPIFDTKPYLTASPKDSYRLNWQSARTFIGATDVSSSQPDELLGFMYIDESVCEIINEKLHGSDTISEYILGSDPQGIAVRYINNSGTVGSINTFASFSYTLPYDEGCFKEAGEPYYHYMVFLRRA